MTPHQSPIRVAFDMTLMRTRIGGSSIYAAALLDALQARADVAMRPIHAAKGGAVSTTRWIVSGADASACDVGAAVLHCPAFLAPLRSSIPFVVNVHDLSMRQMPSGQSLEWRAYYELVFPRLVRRAAAVLTLTDGTGRDVIQAFGVDAERVVTATPGIEPSFFSDEREDRAKPVEAPLIVFPGPPIGRKNLDLVLSAIASAPAASALSRARLEISGGVAGDHPKYRRRIAEIGLDRRVTWLGPLPFSEMPSLYRRADLLVYPSFLEGFGFPPLEAMAAGTPVVASNASCLPEVLGDAALLVDPHDLAGFRDAIESALSDPSMRGRLIERGRARARTFTWSRCADVVAAVYRRVAGS